MKKNFGICIILLGLAGFLLFPMLLEAGERRPNPPEPPPACNPVVTGRVINAGGPVAGVLVYNALNDSGSDDPSDSQEDLIPSSSVDEAFLIRTKSDGTFTISLPNKKNKVTDLWLQTVTEADGPKSVTYTQSCYTSALGDIQLGLMLTQGPGPPH